MKKIYSSKKSVVLLLAILCTASFNTTILTSCGNNSTSINSSDSSTEETLKLLHGELISTTENKIDEKSVVVIKAKIEPSLTTKMTIEQNYYNVEDLILKHDYDKYDEIQYWAVADMTSGSESKVISFTLNKTMIDNVKNEKIAAIEYGKHVDDLWIHPSLKE